MVAVAGGQYVSETSFDHKNLWHDQLITHDSFFIDTKSKARFSKSKPSRKKEHLYYVRIKSQKYFLYKIVKALLIFTFENIPW